MLSSFKKLPKRINILVHSVRFRLALWFVIILGIVLVAFSGFIYARQVIDLRTAAVARLELKARRVGGFLRFSSLAYFQHTPLMYPSDPSSGEPILQEGDVLAFVSTNGQVIQDWGPIDTNGINQIVGVSIKNENPEGGFPGSFVSATVSGGGARSQYLFMAAPIVMEGQQAGYFLIGNLVDPAGQLPRLLASLILGILTTLSVALAGGFWLADRAMRPVKTITQAAQTISETDLSLRLHLDQKDELGELANTFDEMLNRLQAAFERQRQFTADASHELRTPLTIVDLETSRALNGHRSPQEVERALKVIQSENQMMTRMVVNLLTLARMDAGQVTLKKEELDLSDIALEVVERLAPLASRENVRLSVGELPELTILGDRQYLAQMLTNLVENGIKYAAGTEKRISVETGWRDGERGRQAWVRVDDNGPGIPAEHLAHIFDRFFRVDASRTRSTEEQETDGEQAFSGTGLGLSIVQWIVQAHGGEIHVQSEPGKGSSFEVTIPMLSSETAN